MPTWKDTLISDNKKDIQTPTVQIGPSVANREEPSHPDNVQLSDAVIVEHIPKTMRPRATAILKRLKERPDVITWDKM